MVFTILRKLHYKPAVVEVSLLWNITTSPTISLLTKTFPSSTKIHLRSSIGSYLAVLPSHPALSNKKWGHKANHSYRSNVQGSQLFLTNLRAKLHLVIWHWGCFCNIKPFPQVRAVLFIPSIASSRLQNSLLQSWIQCQSAYVQSTLISGYGHFPDDGSGPVMANWTSRKLDWNSEPRA